MYESLFIIEQALEITLGYHINSDLLHLVQPSSNFFKLVPPNKGKAQESMEELIHDFKMHSEGYGIIKNKIYQGIESPKGEFGLTIISQNTKKNRPKRLKLKAPGFNHLQSFNSIVSGTLLTDALTVLGSLDIVFGEVDR